MFGINDKAKVSALLWNLGKLLIHGWVRVSFLQFLCGVLGGLGWAGMATAVTGVSGSKVKYVPYICAIRCSKIHGKPRRSGARTFPASHLILFSNLYRCPLQ